MTSGPPPSEFAMGGILNAAPMAAPNLEPVFPGEEGAPRRLPVLSLAAVICHPLRRQRRRRLTPQAPAAAPPVNALDAAAGNWAGRSDHMRSPRRPAHQCSRLIRAARRRPALRHALGRN